MTPPGPLRRWRTPVVVGLVVIVVAGAAAFANVALLGSAGEDRLGKLRPVDPALSVTKSPATRTAPAARTTSLSPDDDHSESESEQSGDDDD